MGRVWTCEGRGGCSGFPVVGSHLEPFYFQIALSCRFGALLLTLPGFTQLPLSSSRGQGNITGIKKKKKVKEGEWYLEWMCYFLRLKPENSEKISPPVLFRSLCVVFLKMSTYTSFRRSNYIIKKP